MELKELHMNGEELTEVAKNLLKAIMTNIDWVKTKKDLYDLMGELTEEQRVGLEKMFEEIDEAIINIDETIKEGFDAYGYSEMFNDILKSEETELEEVTD